MGMQDKKSLFPACRPRLLEEAGEILKEGIEKGIANSILIKINQIGTLTETFEAIEMAKKARYTAVISDRKSVV